MHHEHQEPPKFPNRINLIWIGGPIKEKYLRSIEQLLKLAKGSGFEINLWVDDISNVYKTVDYSDKKFNIKNLNIKTLNELKEKMRSHPYYSKENNYQRFWDCVDRERVGFKNNAQAADFLRVAILQVTGGGYYLDADIEINPIHETEQWKEYFERSLKLKLKADPAPLGVRGSFYIGDVSVFYPNDITIPIGEVNNSILAFNKDSPILDDVMTRMIESYENLAKNDAYTKINRDDKLPLKEAKKEVDAQLVKQLSTKRYPFSIKEVIKLILRNSTQNVEESLQLTDNGLRNIMTVHLGPRKLKLGLLNFFENQSKSNFSSLAKNVYSTSIYLTSEEDKKDNRGQIAGIKVRDTNDQNWVSKPYSLQWGKVDKELIGHGRLILFIDQNQIFCKAINTKGEVEIVPIKSVAERDDYEKIKTIIMTGGNFTFSQLKPILQELTRYGFLANKKAFEYEDIPIKKFLKNK